MLARDLISDLIPSLKISDSGSDALNWMEVFRVSHLPVVNETEFVGLISDVDIFDLNKYEELMGAYDLSTKRYCIYEHQHIYQVLELMSNLRLTGVPVLSEDEKYLGMITQSDLLREFANISAVDIPGGIIELKVVAGDYSIAEITRIIEDTDTKVLNLYVNQYNNTPFLKITIKLNREDISSVLNAFDRYDYEVIASFSKHDVANDVLVKNYESLMSYLNV